MQLVIALSLAMAGQFDTQNESGYEVLGTPSLPLRYTSRPLSLSQGLFSVDVDVGYTEIREGTPTGTLSLAARYGVTDDFEVGLIAVAGTFSSDVESGLEAPRLIAMYRFVEGDFEIGAQIDLMIPINDGFVGTVELPMLGRIADLFRIDFKPGVATNFIPKPRSSVHLPLAVTAQLFDQMYLTAHAIATIRRLDDPYIVARAGGRLAYTFERRSSAFFDVGVTFNIANISLRGPLPKDPYPGNALSATLNANFFIPGDDTMSFGSFPEF